MGAVEGERSGCYITYCRQRFCSVYTILFTCFYFFIA
jgi:hypothetical protein